MKKRVLIALIVVGALTLPSLFGSIAGADPVPTMLDDVDIGDPAPDSEAGHNIQGWTDVWTCGPYSVANRTGGWCACGGGDAPANATLPLGDMRLIWGDGSETCASENNWASVEMDAGTGEARFLRLNHLDGAADDGFTLYVDGDLVDTYVDVYSTDTWVLTDVDISSGGYSGVLTIQLVATAGPWGGCGTYGQVAFNWIELWGEPAIAVAIDIKPGSEPNSINLGSKGVIPVAILSTDTFDATQVDPDTVELGGAEVAVRGKGSKLMAHQNDVNGDNLLDLVIQVETENLEPDAFQDGLVTLTGNLYAEYGGIPVVGQDQIVVVPPE